MDFHNLTFDVSDDVLNLGLKVACLVMEGVQNTEHQPNFDVYLEQQTNQILEEITREDLKNDPVLQGFRLLHERIGCSNRKNIAASENLMKFLIKAGHLPRVNLLVDIYNLVSIKSHLALGAHDINYISGNVHLKMTAGNEGFRPIGNPGPEPVKPGEYAYIDDNNDVICRLEVRQVEKTKVTLDTKDCFYIIQGNPATSPKDLKAAAENLVELTKRFCGGQEHILYKPW